jgi:hypothetical protein
MCAVSAIHNYAVGLPDDWWNTTTYQWYKVVLDHARQFDALTNQKDCAVTEEEKQAFLDKLDKIVNKGSAG